MSWHTKVMDALDDLVSIRYLKGDAVVGLYASSGSPTIPKECCVLKTTSGIALVEACGSLGLFFAVPRTAKKKISPEGVGHKSVCTSPDGNMVYSTTSNNTICMYKLTVKGDSIRLVGEVNVQGAQHLQGIRPSPSNGNLAVLDKKAMRITLHNPSAVLLRSIGNKAEGHSPRKLDWSQDGNYLFITVFTENKNVARNSVLKLSVGSDAVTWWKPCNSPAKDPALVRNIDGSLYMCHYNVTQDTLRAVVTVMSANDGSIIKIISSPGYVGEIRRSPRAEADMVYYESTTASLCSIM